jgi:hypothetical protein
MGNMRIQFGRLLHIVCIRFARQGQEGRSSAPTQETTMSQQRFPPGCDGARVREVLDHYENQTEDEQFADIEAAQEAEGITMMTFPTELVPAIRALLARKQSA